MGHMVGMKENLQWQAPSDDYIPHRRRVPFEAFQSEFKVSANKPSSPCALPTSFFHYDHRLIQGTTERKTTRPQFEAHTNE